MYHLFGFLVLLLFFFRSMTLTLGLVRLYHFVILSKSLSRTAQRLPTAIKVRRIVTYC